MTPVIKLAVVAAAVLLARLLPHAHAPHLPQKTSAGSSLSNDPAHSQTQMPASIIPKTKSRPDGFFRNPAPPLILPPYVLDTFRDYVLSEAEEANVQADDLQRCFIESQPGGLILQAGQLKVVAHRHQRPQNAPGDLATALESIWSELPAHTRAKLAALDPRLATITLATPSALCFADLPRLAEYSSAPRSWVVQDVIAERSVTAFIGPPGGAKSLLLLAIAGAVSKGLPFAGVATFPRTCLTLSRENPNGEDFRRLQLLNLEESDTFKVWGLGSPAGHPPDVDSEFLQRFAHEHPDALVIFDSFAAHFAQDRGSDNNAQDVRRFFDLSRRLTTLGLTICWIHHPNKSGGTRGSIDIDASVDIAYQVTKNNSGLLRELEVTPASDKMRFPVRTRWALRFNDAEGFSANDSSVSNAADEESKVDRLRALLANHADLSQNQFERLAAANGFGRNEARKIYRSGAPTKVRRSVAGGAVNSGAPVSGAGQGKHDA